MLAEKVPTRYLGDIYNSYDIVGDIAIIRVTEASASFYFQIAETVMEVHKSVKTVLVQRDAVQGDFRLRRLDFVNGENRKTTIHKEWNCLFSVDLENCYFSPRLSFERMRVAKQVRDRETALNMFAGVGCFSVVMARYSNVAKVYSVDINPCAVRHMEKNVGMNRVGGKVFPVQGDAKEIVQSKMHRMVDRVLMPLPEKAFEYLPFALMALKQGSGWIHYYDFAYGKTKENAVQKVLLKVSERLRDLNISHDFAFFRTVRSTGPNWYQVVLDINVHDRGGMVTAD
jgi:tRNA (guanine37-N1)-methyltransferase